MSCTSLCDDLHVDHIDDEVEVDIEKGEDDSENYVVDEMLHNLEDERTDRPHMYMIVF